MLGLFRRPELRLSPQALHLREERFKLCPRCCHHLVEIWLTNTNLQQHFANSAVCCLSSLHLLSSIQLLPEDVPVHLLFHVGTNMLFVFGSEFLKAFHEAIDYSVNIFLDFGQPFGELFGKCHLFEQVLKVHRGVIHMRLTTATTVVAAGERVALACLLNADEHRFVRSVSAAAHILVHSYHQ